MTQKWSDVRRRHTSAVEREIGRKVAAKGMTLKRRAYRALVSLLDAPPRPNARLRKSLETPAPWEKE